MSKRTRGTNRTTARRSGQRGRVEAPRRPAAPSAPAPAAASTEGASPAATVTAAAQAPVANVIRTGRVRPNSLLAARAAEEYVYVAQDLRRIALVAVLLFGLLFATWIAIQVLGFAPK